jgi:hypothetical protein
MPSREPRYRRRGGLSRIARRPGSGDAGLPDRSLCGNPLQAPAVKAAVRPSDRRRPPPRRHRPLTAAGERCRSRLLRPC